MDPEKLIEFRSRPEFSGPALVFALEGWTDIGLAATIAIDRLRKEAGAEKIASFDSDALIDYRARRPVLTIVSGVGDRLDWNEVEIQFGRLPNGQELLFLVGPEPDFNWKIFTRAVVDFAKESGVTVAIGLGSFPAPVPHTRNVPLVSTSSNPKLAGRIGFVPGTIQVPAGIQAVIEKELGEAEIDAVGLWARVPHYLAGMSWPPAAVSLLEGVEHLLEFDIDASELSASAAEVRAKVDELVSQSDETREYVQRLEGASMGTEDLDMAGMTGEELATELEQFLAEQGSDQRDDGQIPPLGEPKG